MTFLKECNRGLAKGLFMATNALCILIAYCILGFAVVDIRVLKVYGEDEASGTLAGDVIIICASLLLLGLASLGILGVLKKSIKMLYMYVCLVMALIVLELLITIFVAIQRHGLQYRVTEWLREDFFQNLTIDNNELHNQLWDKLQTRFECCGLNGPEDYSAIKQPIPLSCCSRAYRAPTDFAKQQLFKSCLETSTYYIDGCEDEILDILRADADWLLGTAVFCFWVEAAGMMLAMWVVSNLKNAVEVYQHTVKY